MKDSSAEALAAASLWTGAASPGTSAASPGTGAARKSWHGVHKALADPLRIRLLDWLLEAPRSARELADCAGLPADRLYYHLGQLEQARMIEIAEYRPLARGKVERIYAPAETEPPGDDADPEETAAFLGSMLEATAIDITAAFQAKREGRRREVDLRRGAVRLTDQALAELRGHIDQLAGRFADPGGDGTWTRVLLTIVDLQDRPECDTPPGSPA
jgi:DNA-binding transcriptional ArsR family regulator